MTDFSSLFKYDYKPSLVSLSKDGVVETTLSDIINGYRRKLINGIEAPNFDTLFEVKEYQDFPCPGFRPSR